LNVFNEEWDLLIILNTCRPDALRQVSDEYPFVEAVDSKWSVGGTSSEWMYNTFDEEFQEDISNTSLVTSNAYAWGIFESGFRAVPLRNFKENTYEKSVKSPIQRLKRYATTSPVSRDSFDKVTVVTETSKKYGPVNYPSPRRVTDHVIRQDRSDNPPMRVVAHYMPPHSPYITQLADGELQFTEARSMRSFEAYIDNLRWALDEVSLLLENVNRDRIVITADHGENFRLRPVLNNHGVGMITPAVRRVPWVETSASDERTYEPDLSDDDTGESMTPEETLQALGYL
jgi:arylsulfatase A-like enzyme